MSIKANWPFYNATLAGSPGPTLDCVRATPGFVSDWAGGFKYVTNNKPRFAGLTGMTNILKNSDDLTHADWNKELLETPVQDGTLDPFGNPAWKLQATTGTGFHMLQQEAINPFVGPKTMERTFGCLIKADTAQYAALGFYDHDAASLSGGTTVVDLTNGTVTDSCSYYEDNGDGGNGRQDVFHPMGDGWYWIDVDVFASANNSGAGADSFCIFITDDPDAANMSYTGAGESIYVSKCWASMYPELNGYNNPYPFWFAEGTGDDADTTYWANKKPRVNLCHNAEMHGYTGKGSTPYGYGYYHTQCWSEGTTTGNGTAVLAKPWRDMFPNQADPYTQWAETFNHFGDSAWAATRTDKVKKAVRCSGTNQQYFLNYTNYYNGAYESGEPHVFSIVIEDVVTRPTGPILSVAAAHGGATATMPEGAGPGTVVSVPITNAQVWSGYDYVSIGLGADGNNDTGDFTWSSPMMESGTVATPYMPNEATNFAELRAYYDDFSPNIDENAGLLVAPALTDALNATAVSRDYDDASWVKVGAAGSHAGFTNSTHIRNRNRFAGTGGGTGEVSLAKDWTSTASTEYTMEANIRISSTSWQKFEITNMGVLNPYINYNFDVGRIKGFQTAALGTVSGDVDSSGHTASVENGMGRCWMTFTSDATDTAVTVKQYAATADDVTSNAPRNDSLLTGSVFYMDVMIYEGKYRPYEHLGWDVMTVNADDISTTDMSWYDETGGTLFIDFTTGYDVASVNMFAISDGTNNNKIQLVTTAGGNGELLIADGGASQANISLGAIAANTRYRFAVSFAANDVKVSMDGAVAGTADTSATLPTGLTQFDVGQNPSGTGQLGGLVHQIVYDNQPSSQARLDELTSADGYTQVPTGSLFNQREHEWFCALNGESIDVDGFHRALRRTAGIDERDESAYSTQDLYDRTL